MAGNFRREIGRTWPLWIACILHGFAALLFGMHVAPREHGSSVDAAASSIEVTLDRDEERAAQSGAAHEASTQAAAASNASAEMSQRREIQGAIAIAREGASQVSSTPSSEPMVRPLAEDGAADGTWTFRTTRDVDLKLGDRTASLGRTMAAHGNLELPPPPSPAGMTEGLDAIDVERGFGRGGAVVQAIEDVVRDPAAPPEGVAVFEVAIEKSGKITVSVAETSANREEWERLTNDIAARVKTKDVRFPEQGAGLRIGVRVEAKVRYPDGRDPKKNGTYAHGNGFKTHTDKNGLVLDELPEVSMGARGKVCSGAVSLTLLGPRIGGGCEPANIGTHPERTVGAREVYEKRM